MPRHTFLRPSLLVSIGILAAMCPARSPAGDAAGKADARPPAELGRRVQDVTEAVLRHHINPPTRQQMVLDGVRRLYLAAGMPSPPGLARRISTLTTPEQFSAFLGEVWPSSPAQPRPRETLENALLDGLLAGVPGGSRLSAKEHRIQEQLAGNRYVGIHIQLSHDEKEHRSIVMATVPGGPADRAGMRKEDRIEAVDGVDTRKMSLSEVVDRLRGESGTDVVVQVRQPGAKEARILKMTRGTLFLPTVTGLFKHSTGEWDYHAGDSDETAYLKISNLSASTPHELRRCAESLRNQGFRALVLDLRGLASMASHPAVLVADALLDRGRIGQVREADRVQTFDATPGSLFPDWPVAVLIDEGTLGGAEWLAAALQDNHRAMLVGRPTGSSRSGRPQPGGRRPSAWGLVFTTIPVGPEAKGGYLSLLTGRIERGDGQPIAADVGSPASADSQPEPSALPASASGGVKPDHLVPAPRGRRDPSREGRGGFGMGPADGDPWADRELSEAVRLLARPRDSL